jgi:mannose-6-phosphate isomerase
VHAIGAGLVIFEIQQNSDTTFRVFDWNRVGLDGKPRELHVPQSLRSIDFADVEPALQTPDPVMHGYLSVRPVVRHPLFNTNLVRAEVQDVMRFDTARLRVVGVVNGRVRATAGGAATTLGAGQFCLLPASLSDAALHADRGTTFLVVDAGT